MKQYGIANFIYADSEYVFVHSHKRLSNKGETTAGLHILSRSCKIKDKNNIINGLDLSAQESQEVILVASVPLSNESWNALKEGEIKVLQNGRIIEHISLGASDQIP
jgi:glutamine amidotransferase